MPDKIELSKSDFVSVMAAATGRCGPWLPGNEGIPGWIEPDPEACRHWLEMVAVMRVADVVIERAIAKQEIGAALGDNGSEIALESNQSAFRRALEEICGTPPRLPIGWPPRGPRLDPAGLTAPQLLAVAARFQAAADQLGEHVLAPALAETADGFFENGLARIAQLRT